MDKAGKIAWLKSERGEKTSYVHSIRRVQRDLARAVAWREQAQALVDRREAELKAHTEALEHTLDNIAMLEEELRNA